MTAPVLSTRDLTVRYGGVVANDQVCVTVGRGEIVGLIGPNGAGKTSFIDAVSGFTGCTGEIELAGTPLGSLPAHRRARLGLARTWQSIELFRDLSVYENALVASRRFSLGRLLTDLVRPGREDDDAQVWAALDLVGLRDLAHRSTDELSLGQRKLLGVARALAARPKVLLLDEPAAGLDVDESKELGDRLRGVVADGISVLLVDHDMGLVLEVCDQVYVLEFGKLIAQGTPAEMRTDPAVVAAYLGTAAEVAT
ncbi:ABC transporter ATP-binding protein [Kribbella sp. NPDC051586]|uniref:ABC transporter ATP-binding protein n=1 Tax=Kribbella sp. NPDC051586 TaxID=3364118 RepID=UPI0037B76E5E